MRNLSKCISEQQHGGAFNISSLFAKQAAPEKAQILQDLLLAASHLKAPDNEQSDKLTNLLGDKLPQLPISQMLLQLKCCTEKKQAWCLTFTVMRFHSQMNF